MSKMGSHNPFGHPKHKLGPKEGSEVKLAIWLLTTKSQESPWFACVQMASNIPLESPQQGLQLYFRLHFNQRSEHKVMGPQSCGSPNCGNFRTPIWESRTKWHLGASPVAKHKVYYKGEGGDFPQVRVMVSLVSPSLLVACPNTKSAPTMH